MAEIGVEEIGHGGWAVLGYLRETVTEELVQVWGHFVMKQIVFSQIVIGRIVFGQVVSGYVVFGQDVIG